MKNYKTGKKGKERYKKKLSTEKQQRRKSIHIRKKNHTVDQSGGNKVKENKMEEKKVKEDKVEEDKVKQIKVEENKVKENKVEENKMEGNKVEENKRPKENQRRNSRQIRH